MFAKTYSGTPSLHAPLLPRGNCQINTSNWASCAGLRVGRKSRCVVINTYQWTPSHQPRKVDIRLPGKENSSSHGARPAHQTISMIKWVRTSMLSFPLPALPTGTKVESGTSESKSGTFVTLSNNGIYNSLCHTNTRCSLVGRQEVEASTPARWPCQYLKHLLGLNGSHHTPGSYESL